MFGGPTTYTDELGGYPRLLAKHLNRALTEERRARWVQLIATAADEAGLPADPEFRSAFIAYIEWGTRIALANSQPGATPPPPAGARDVPQSAAAPAARDGAAPPISAHGDNAVSSFTQDIRPLFRDKDVQSMAWAFDPSAYEARAARKRDN